MAARRTWTECKVERFRQLVAKGLPRDIIAQRLGKTIRQLESLHSHMRKKGEVLPPLAPVEIRNCPISRLSGREGELAEMSRKGMGSRTIARQIGSTPGTVSGFMQRRGLCANPKRWGPPPQTFRLAVNLARLNLPARAAEADVRLGEALWRGIEEMAG
jgi:DNA-binding CsgD family transcriptional regulator